MRYGLSHIGSPLDRVVRQSIERAKMAEYTDLKVCVLSTTANAVQCTVHEGEPEEQDIWIPLSVLEDPSVIEEDNLDMDNCTTISIKRWFCKKSDIPYDAEASEDYDGDRCDGGR